MNAIDCEDIIDARVRGESVRSICKRLGCSLADVNDVLDQFATQTITEKLRTHTLALKLSRLDRLQEVFERQATAGDVASAHLVTKLIERRCIMLGLSAPPRVDPQIIEQATAPKQSSTERIYSIIERIAALPAPEGGDANDEPDEGQIEPSTNGEGEAG